MVMDDPHDLSLLLRQHEQGMDVFPIRQRETQVLPLRNEGVDDGGVGIPQFIDNTSGSYNHAKHEEIRSVSHALNGRGFIRPCRTRCS